MKPPASLCVLCKGTKKLCGLEFCPILTKLKTKYSLLPNLTTSISGASKEIFVGSYGYPNVAVGPLVGLNQRPLSPQDLYLRDYEEIISHRMRFVRGKEVVKTTARMQVEMVEVALSIRAVESEMELKRPPTSSAIFSSELQPMGPSAPIKKFRQTENPRIPKKVDNLVEEDLLATDAVRELIHSGFDNYYITNIFSSGALGKKKNKKIVPTKWSITALHDIIAKQGMEEIREFGQMNDVLLFHHYSLGNSYFVLLIPGSWEFENFESWSPKSIWAENASESITTVEHEPYPGRTKYADKQVGGYYASRYSVVQHLRNIRKQAKAVVIREIDEAYIVPIGVFQVQEGVKNALNSMPIRFGTLQEAINYLSTKTRVNMKRYLGMSHILNQSTLNAFL